MKEARNFIIQEQNAERIMKHLRRSLLTQGFVEVEPGIFERTDARGFKSQVRKATPIEQATMKPGRVYPDTEAFPMFRLTEDLQLVERVEKDKG